MELSWPQRKHIFHTKIQVCDMIQKRINYKLTLMCLRYPQLKFPTDTNMGSRWSTFLPCPHSTLFCSPQPHQSRPSSCGESSTSPDHRPLTNQLQQLRASHILYNRTTWGRGVRHVEQCRELAAILSSTPGQ
jgi:hypothetical protein